MTSPDDRDLDTQNAEFWNELCGTTLARRKLGTIQRTPEDLRRFDDVYLDFYPYLEGYFPEAEVRGKRVLEIGLGYGTIGQLLIDRGARYSGVDISPGPVDMMQFRIASVGRADTCNARVASALALPFEDETFDVVVSIGCLHHTGDLPGAISEARRVLRPGGVAIVMIYNARSARRVSGAPRRFVRSKVDRARAETSARAAYDADQAGNAAPHTDFLTITETRQAFGEFSEVEITKRNIDVAHASFLRRPLLACRIDRLVGLDLYVRAVA